MQLNQLNQLNDLIDLIDLVANMPFAIKSMVFFSFLNGPVQHRRACPDRRTSKWSPRPRLSMRRKRMCISLVQMALCSVDEHALIRTSKWPPGHGRLWEGSG